MTTFINDIEKMSDLLQAITENNISGFLNSYSYLTKEEQKDFEDYCYNIAC